MRMGLIYTTGVLAAASALGAAGDLATANRTSAYIATAAENGTAHPSGGPAIERASDGLFYIDGTVGNTPVHFLVDTGASHVVLSHADARAGRWRQLSGRTESIRTAGGAVKVEWIVIDRLEVDGVVLDNVEAVIPEKDMGTSLLGQNALARFSRIEINGDQLLLER